MDLIGLELDSGSPVMLSMPEFEPLDLMWRKGPVEEPLRGLPASIFEPQPALKLLAPTEEEEMLIGEDEMAAWLHYPIDMTDTRASLNRQTGAGSSNSPPSVLIGNAAELDCQVLQPVLQGNDAKSDCQVGPMEIKHTCTEKAGASGLQRGLKSKGNEKNRFERHNEFSTTNSDEKKKDALHRSTSPRNSRTSKYHNLSEQKRRSRINEKMKTLQGLLPRSIKLDKASILDATIAHVKSLQQQVEMISMGFPMRPPIFSSGPPYIQSMPLMPSIGTGFGMNTDTRVSMNMATMAMPPVMPPFGPAILYPHINQHIQAPILQITHQHMAAEMFPYSHAGDPYHFPSVVPGQVSPQHTTANKTWGEKKQAEAAMKAQYNRSSHAISQPNYFAL